MFLNPYLKKKGKKNSENPLDGLLTNYFSSPLFLLFLEDKKKKKKLFISFTFSDKTIVPFLLS